jgi:NAD(P)-dependent dehydrogenase (short-subunit alcohol dehydrogenase family)
MRAAGWGRVINVASAHGLTASPFKSAYVAAKHGLVGLTKVTALDCAGQGVTANAILPGAIETGMTQPAWETHPEAKDLWAKKAALRRLGQPIDIARAAAFLASDDAGFITGQAITVDGGLTLRV